MATVRELLAVVGFSVDEASQAKAVAAGNLVAKAISGAVEWADRLAHSFVENVKGAIEYGDKINKTSQSIGIATDALQELQFAGSMADLSAEEMSQSIGILSRQMLAAKNGSQEASKAFRGIDFKNKDGTLKSADEVLGSIADKFQAMPDGVEKTALAMDLLGRSGKKMIPFLNEGSEKLAELRQEARDLGLVMDSDAVRASEELNDNLERLHAVSRGLWRQAIAPLIPEFNKLVRRILEWRKANAAILAQKLRQFMGAMITAVRALGHIFQSLVRILTAAKSVLSFFATAVSSWLGLLIKEAPIAAGAIAILAGALILLNAPMLAAILFFGLLYLAVDDLVGFIQGKDSLLGRWLGKFDDWIKPRAGDTWFVAAIKEFVTWIKQAIKFIDEFYASMGMTNPKEMDRRAGASSKEVQRQADVQTLATARQRSALGLPLTQAAQEALARANVSSAGFLSKYGQVPGALSPEFRGPMSYGGSSVQAPVSIQVTTQPGQSNEAIAEMVAGHVQRHWDTKMEETESGVLR